MKIATLSYAMVACLSLTTASIGLSAEKEKSEASSQSGHEAKPAAMDKAWANMSAMMDLAEIQVSKAAEEKATSEQVKQFAAQLVKDHTKNLQELKQIASKSDIELKTELPEEKKKMIQEFAAKSGPEFDQTYMEHQLAAHRMAVAHYQNGAELLKDQQLQSFAQKTLPTIQQHLAMTQKYNKATTQTEQPGQPGSSTAGSRPGAGAGQATQPGQPQPAQQPQSRPQSGQVTTPGTQQ